MKAEGVQADIARALGFDEAQAGQAAEVVLRAVGRRLSGLAARSVAVELPEAWASALKAANNQLEAGPLAALYQEVAASLEVPEGEGLEVTQVVCQQLGESFSPGVRHALGEALPERWADLFAPGEQARALTDPVAGVPPQSRSIAEGPRGRAPNKLSSGQPRATTILADGRVHEGETLAEAGPGGPQPVSKGSTS